MAKATTRQARQIERNEDGPQLAVAASPALRQNTRRQFRLGATSALWLKPEAALCLLFLLALFLRLYRLDIGAWVPDSYDRLTDAVRMAHGHLPRSRIYPPGVALILMPAVALFPASLA